MGSVIIANNNPTEIEELKKIIGQEFDTHSVESPTQFDAQSETFDLILLDYNFTKDEGSDFLMKILGKSNAPVLIATPPDAYHWAVEPFTPPTARNTRTL